MMSSLPPAGASSETIASPKRSSTHSAEDLVVISAKAGSHSSKEGWIRTCAEMTNRGYLLRSLVVISAKAGTYVTLSGRFHSTQERYSSCHWAVLRHTGIEVS